MATRGWIAVLPAVFALVVLAFVAAPAWAQSASPQASSVPMSFDVATIRPTDPAYNRWQVEFKVDGFVAKGATLDMLLQEAFGLYLPDSVTGGPAWAGKQRFDIQAKFVADDLKQYEAMTLAQRRAMLLDLLRTRFGLVTHTEEVKRPGFALVVAHGGLKLKPTQTEKQNDIQGYDGLITVSGPGRLEAKRFTMSDIAGWLQVSWFLPVEDQTHVAGRYDIALHWEPTEITRKDGTRGTNGSDPDAMAEALEQQAGLRAERTTLMQQIIVIDHASEPSAN